LNPLILVISAHHHASGGMWGSHPFKRGWPLPNALRVAAG